MHTPHTRTPQQMHPRCRVPSGQPRRRPTCRESRVAVHTIRVRHCSWVHSTTPLALGVVTHGVAAGVYVRSALRWVLPILTAPCDGRRTHRYWYPSRGSARQTAIPAQQQRRDGSTISKHAYCMHCSLNTQFSAVNAYLWHSRPRHDFFACDFVIAWRLHGAARWHQAGWSCCCCCCKSGLAACILLPLGCVTA